MKRLAVLCFICAALLVGCAADSGRQEDTLAANQTEYISTARELEDFFDSGPASAQLAADIDMGDTMLKVIAARGKVELVGGGYTLSGNAPCVIRLDDGCAIKLTDINIKAGQTGLGLLGSGSITGTGCAISAQVNAVQAAGAVTVVAGSALALRAEEGSGLICIGLELGQDSRLTVQAAAYAINTGRGDFVLQAESQANCVANGDNVVKADGTLMLGEKTVLQATNTGDHNAVKAGTLQAAPDAALEAEGGANGVGLFVVEQYEGVALKGFCRPEVRVEAGKGVIAFS